MEPETARTARTSGATATQGVRVALQSLVKEVRRVRLYGGAQLVVADSRFASMYVAAMRQALAELPVLVLGVTPDAIRVADADVLHGSERGDIPDRLYAEGTRAISVETDATDDELIALGNLLVTPWGEGGEESLTDAVWMANLHHVAFEMVERVGERGAEPLSGDSPLVRSLLGLVEEINRRSPEDAGRIRQDEFAILRRLQEELGSTDVAPVAAVSAANLSAGMRAEVEAARTGGDLDGINMLAILATCATATDAPALVDAMLTVVLDAMDAPEPDDTAAGRLRSELDPDHAGDDRLARRFEDWGACAPEVRQRFLSLVERRGETVAGPLFSMFGLLRGDAARQAISADLPTWAVRVLVDAWLVDEAPADPAAEVRRLLQLRDREPVRLALALARRVDHLPLVEPILTVLERPEADLREEALVALRRYQTPRLREATHKHLDDPAAGVRLEALRYVVAYRDVDVVGRLEARLLSASPAHTEDAELRAIGIAIGRLLRERAEGHLIPVALGARVAAHPFAPSAALHGLRAIGSATARSAIARIGADVPALSELAHTLLGTPR